MGHGPSPSYILLGWVIGSLGGRREGGDLLIHDVETELLFWVQKIEKVVQLHLYFFISFLRSFLSFAKREEEPKASGFLQENIPLYKLALLMIALL